MGFPPPPCRGARKTRVMCAIVRGHNSCTLSGQDNACHCTSITCVAGVRLAFVSGAFISAMTSAGAMEFRPLVASWPDCASLFHALRRLSSKSTASLGCFWMPFVAASTIRNSQALSSSSSFDRKVASFRAQPFSVSFPIPANLLALSRERPLPSARSSFASISGVLFVGRPIFAMSWLLMPKLSGLASALAVRKRPATRKACDADNGKTQKKP